MSERPDPVGAESIAENPEKVAQTPNLVKMPNHPPVLGSILSRYFWPGLIWRFRNWIRTSGGGRSSHDVDGIRQEWKGKIRRGHLTRQTPTPSAGHFFSLFFNFLVHQITFQISAISLPDEGVLHVFPGKLGNNHLLFIYTFVICMRWRLCIVCLALAETLKRSWTWSCENREIVTESTRWRPGTTKKPKMNWTIITTEWLIRT